MAIVVQSHCRNVHCPKLLSLIINLAHVQLCSLTKYMDQQPCKQFFLLGQGMYFVQFAMFVSCKVVLNCIT